MVKLNLLEATNYAAKSLRKTTLRSVLTIFGIVIGVITLVVILSISDGVQKDINDQLASFGPDKMFIVPVNVEDGGLGALGGAGPAQSASSGKLFKRDAESVAGIPGVKSVARMVFGRASLKFKKTELTAPIYGVDPEFYEQYDDYVEIETGRMYQEGERKVIVLGYDAANDLWGRDKVSVGNYLIVNGEKYRVVGIMKEIGTSMSASDDSAIYVPFKDGEDLFSDQLSRNEIGYIALQTDEGFDPGDIKDSIERKLASNHKVTMDNLDFTVVTSDFINETVGSILGLLSTFLFAITVIASVVGAIGISNTMFMGVLERVKEIGIMKAIGATHNDIMSIFIIESALLGLAGGLVGMVLGVLILLPLSEFGIPYVISPGVILFAFLFSAGTGMLAGIIPAREAAKLDPVEALRY